MTRKVLPRGALRLPLPPSGPRDGRRRPADAAPRTAGPGRRQTLKALHTNDQTLARDALRPPPPHPRDPATGGEDGRTRPTDGRTERTT
ncbi:hypothetical protein GCM10010233_05300 [Streptomyces pseudogriseolus]|uniref:Uncharacterized protein n=1 Tax=Streptomyces pseudogriseolus TaxID=36817 RepID=A0ABQ2SMC9_STREZ|nr:hypothetical protein GCM10010233_05300 [Streptomyces gancidicus]GGS34231.1 hypothetical protein GCM10010285_11570 [Streptomyces rubiginosus]